MALREFQSYDRPRRLFVQRAVWDLEHTQEIVREMPELTAERVDSEADIHGILDREEAPETVGKSYLYLAGNPNRFFKLCPGLVPDLACCDVHVLNFAVGCNLDCTYCFLQTYLPYSLVTYFVNLDDMFRELDELLEQRPREFMRVCTGELTDSLSLDPLVHLSRRLVTEFTRRERVSLELKTKTANIAELEGLDPKGRVIVSWTVNAESVSRREELRCVSLDERFRAAAQAEAWGYRIGFHFDPIIHYPGWDEEYRRTVERIFETVRPASLAWISLGCLRFDPRLKEIVQRRFPGSRFVYGEFIPGPDGKMRYPETLRVEMFSKMKEWIYAHWRRSGLPLECLPLYLCMESYSVWEKVFGRAPRCRGDMARMLDESIERPLHDLARTTRQA